MQDVSAPTSVLLMHDNQHHGCTNCGCNFATNVCRSNWNDNCFCSTGTGITYSIDGSTYTNTTGIFTNVAATYSVTVKMLQDVSLL
jgi:hypothetical protein